MFCGKLLVLYYLIKSVSSLNILVVFPVPARSHGNYGSGFARILLNAGHKVTFVTPFPEGIKENLTYIDLSSFQGALDTKVNISLLMSDEEAVKKLSDPTFGYYWAEKTIKHPNFQRILMDPEVKFDLVIAERFICDVYSGFRAVFKVPLIYFNPVEVFYPIYYTFYDLPNPSYSPNILADLHPPYDFWQRVNSLYLTIMESIYYRFIAWPAEELVYNRVFKPITEKRKVDLPSYKDSIKSADLALSSSHYTLSHVKAFPENIRNIGGFHIVDGKELPQDLKSILDKAENGVVYFSMGSNIKSKDMSKELKQSILDVFRRIKQTVLWKFEEDLPNKPQNVIIRTWFPQASILAHPNVKVFITHGGLLSITESVHFGVPLIGIPVFADQFINMRRAKMHGYALQVKLSYGMAKDLEEMLKQILNDESFRRNAKRISAIYHDRPIKPSDEILFWVDHLHKFDSGAHLNSPARYLPLYKKYYLDLFALLLVTAMTVSVATCILVKRLCRNRCSKRVTQDKKNK